MSFPFGEFGSEKKGKERQEREERKKKGKRKEKERKKPLNYSISEEESSPTSSSHPKKFLCQINRQPIRVIPSHHHPLISHS